LIATYAIPICLTIGAPRRPHAEYAHLYNLRLRPDVQRLRKIMGVPGLTAQTEVRDQGGEARRLQRTTRHHHHLRGDGAWRGSEQLL